MRNVVRFWFEVVIPRINDALSASEKEVEQI